MADKVDILMGAITAVRFHATFAMTIRTSHMPNLVNVKLDVRIPGIGGIAGTWEPDESEIRAAWELYVEMVTRTPLGSASIDVGSARETLASIYSLFDTTRDILKKYGPSVARPKNGRELSFGYLAVSMLNLTLRPFLNEWHLKLSGWERENANFSFAEWPGRCDFMRSLNETRERLRQYAGLFAQVADVPELLE